MKEVRVSRVNQHEGYSPPGHHNITNYLLVAQELGDSDRTSVWHGDVGPGGSAEAHVHEGSEQIYVVIAGAITVTADGCSYVLEAVSSLRIPRGVAHELRNDGSSRAELLVISSPALR